MNGFKPVREIILAKYRVDSKNLKMSTTVGPSKPLRGLLSKRCISAAPINRCMFFNGCLWYPVIGRIFLKSLNLGKQYDLGNDQDLRIGANLFKPEFSANLILSFIIFLQNKVSLLVFLKFLIENNFSSKKVFLNWSARAPVDTVQLNSSYSCQSVPQSSL